ncbi:hypothetical protein [Nocardioides bigeumensis]|uniref:hypothetical protein n=1 Tax=Nocardioides bigeumensis TaxID=433657 RepID=UPI0031D4D676
MASAQEAIDPWAGLDEPLTRAPSDVHVGEERTWSASRRSQGLALEVTASASAADAEAHAAVDALLLSIETGLPATGFRFVNQGSGWAEAAVRFGSRVFSESASYLSDALGDPVRAALALLLGSDLEEFSWYDEPGSVTVELSRRETTGDLMDVRCAVDPNGARAAGRQLVGLSSRSSLAWAVAHGARQQLALHGAEGFERLWLRHRFPVDELDELERVLPDASLEPWILPAGWQVSHALDATASEVSSAFAPISLAVGPRPHDPLHDPLPWTLTLDGTAVAVTDIDGLVEAMLLVAEDLLAGVEVDRAVWALTADPHDDPKQANAVLRMRGGSSGGLRIDLVHGGSGDVLLDVRTPALGFAVEVERMLHELVDARPEDPWGGTGTRPFPYDGWARLHAALGAAGRRPRRVTHPAPSLLQGTARFLGFDDEVVPPILRRAVCLATSTEGVEHDEAMLRLGRLLLAPGDGGRARRAFEVALTSADEATRCAAVLAVSPMLDDRSRVEMLLTGLLDSSDRTSAREAARRLVLSRLGDDALAAGDPAVVVLAAEDPATLARLLVEANEERHGEGSDPELLQAAHLAVGADVPHLGLALRAAACLARLRATGDPEALVRAQSLRVGLLRLRRGDRAASRDALAGLAASGADQESLIAQALLSLSPDAVTSW